MRGGGSGGESEGGRERYDIHHEYKKMRLSSRLILLAHSWSLQQHIRMQRALLVYLHNFLHCRLIVKEYVNKR